MDIEIVSLEKELENSNGCGSKKSFELSPALLKTVKKCFMNMHHVIDNLASLEEKRAFVVRITDRIFWENGSVEIVLKNNAAVE